MYSTGPFQSFLIFASLALLLGVDSAGPMSAFGDDWNRGRSVQYGLEDYKRVCWQEARGFVEKHGCEWVKASEIDRYIARKKLDGRSFPRVKSAEFEISLDTFRFVEECESGFAKRLQAALRGNFKGCTKTAISKKAILSRLSRGEDSDRAVNDSQRWKHIPEHAPELSIEAATDTNENTVVVRAD
ncbi:MAG: hypothetical protein A2603_07755 [Bdellovibrionales bacterium RIFOXYD1_FULL_55_31]|nr:MAG: hypothetical protein A2603_07755 [Bdellovibrionales bacterium RIFOXYD1_FULL_55_31]